MSTPKPTFHPALPQGSLILVTGANGYIGSHIIAALLDIKDSNYRVRGTVRAPKPWLDEYFRSRYGEDRFESMVLDSLEEGALAGEHVMGGVAGLVHVATDTSLGADPGAMIDRVTAGIRNVLEAAHKTSTVQRVVLTSSALAAAMPQPDVEGIVVRKDSYNDSAVQTALNSDLYTSFPAEQKGFISYCASKAESERFAWKWMEEVKPQFVFNTVLPDFVFGPTLSPDMNASSMGYTRAVLKGETLIMAMIHAQHFVSVKDTTLLHVSALLNKDVNSERIFAYAGPFNWTQVLGILRELRPDNKLIPAGPENEGRDLAVVEGRGRAEELLVGDWGRKGWEGLKECLESGIEGF